MSNVAFEGGGAREWKTHQMDSVPVRLKIEAFEGSKEQLTSWMTGDRGETAMSNVYAQIQLVNQGRPMGLPTRTGYTMFGAQCVWGEMVSFNHCRLSDLPRTAEIHVTLAALDAPLTGRHGMPSGSLAELVPDRAGDVADRGDELRALLRDTVVDKLRVANPGYLD